MRASDGTGQQGKVAPKHVWVKYGSQASPGVLLDWRRNRDGGWEAYVTYATGGGTSSVTVTTQWLPSAHVLPLEPR